MPEMIRNIYCDSRFRTPQSASSSDFEVDLPNSVVIPRKAIGWVSDLHLPVSFYNVDEHNNVMYLNLTANYNGSTENRVKAVTLTPKNYSGETLAEEIATKLNETSTQINAKIFTRYEPSEGVIYMAYGLGALFEGVYTRSEVAPYLHNAAQAWNRTGLDYKAWSADANDPYKFIHSTNRIITFTAFSSISNTASFTETLADGTEYIFTYDSTIDQFVSPSVGWNWQPPLDFAWSGIYPVSAGNAKLTKTSEGVFL